MAFDRAKTRSARVTRSAHDTRSPRDCRMIAPNSTLSAPPIQPPRPSEPCRSSWNRAHRRSIVPESQGCRKYQRRERYRGGVRSAAAERRSSARFRKSAIVPPASTLTNEVERNAAALGKIVGLAHLAIGHHGARAAVGGDCPPGSLRFSLVELSITSGRHPVSFRMCVERSLRRTDQRIRIGGDGHKGCFQKLPLVRAPDFDIVLDAAPASKC